MHATQRMMQKNKIIPLISETVDPYYCESLFGLDKLMFFLLDLRS